MKKDIYNELVKAFTAKKNDSLIIQKEEGVYYVCLNGHLCARLPAEEYRYYFNNKKPLVFSEMASNGTIRDGREAGHIDFDSIFSVYDNNDTWYATRTQYKFIIPEGSAAGEETRIFLGGGPGGMFTVYLAEKYGKALYPFESRTGGAPYKPLFFEISDTFTVVACPLRTPTNKSPEKEAEIIAALIEGDPALMA